MGGGVPEFKKWNPKKSSKFLYTKALQGFSKKIKFAHSWCFGVLPQVFHYFSSLYFFSTMTLRLNHCFTLAVLLASLSPAFAQDAVSVSDSSSSSTGSVIVPSSTSTQSTPSGLLVPGSSVTTTTDTTIYQSEAPSFMEGGDSFFLPGGYGYLPQSIATNEGVYARPPIDFSVTLQQGYNDNIYSVSGNNGVPVKGSWVTQAGVGLDVQLAQNRTLLALGMDVGGMYYCNKGSQAFSPTGHLDLSYAYKLTPRLQFSARVNGGYYSQPNLTLQNAPSVNAGDYFNLNNLFDLSYQWTPRFATDTTLGVNTQIFREGRSQGSNYVEGTVGESFRFTLTPRVIFVMEGRGSQIWYNDSLQDSTTEFALTGLDLTLSPRLSATFRVGATFRQFKMEGAPDATSPYFESALGYRYGRGSVVQWTNRFGFEESNSPTQRDQSYRTGLQVNHVLTPRLSVNAGVYYSHERLTDFFSSDKTDQDLITANCGLQFVVTRSITVYGNYTHSQVISDDSFSEYSRNEVYFGAAYHF